MDCNNAAMLRVGLTGGIGSGKSTVAQRLAEHGALVVDADRVAREVVEPGTEGLAAIVEEFGDDVLTAAGALDRPKLAGRVFANDATRATLNSILHPRIGLRTAELMSQAAPDAVVVHDVPLLVENNLAPIYHLVIVVDAPEEARVHRLVHDRGLPELDARSRIAAQATREQRWAVADVWLDNSGHRDEVLADVDALWADRLVPFEANVRLGRAAQASPVLVDHDQTWPAQADRLLSRLTLAAGSVAQRIDHIGSTAVPGLPAVDVLDVLLTVGNTAEAYRAAEELRAAGFAAHPEVGPDPSAWLWRYHCGADPERPATVHLQLAGRPAWRFALLFPAWLRGDHAARDEFAALKAGLAQYFQSTGDSAGYANAKGPWFASARQRAEEWAQRTGWTP